MQDLDWTRIVLLYTVLLISLVVHEASHAWLGFLGGDRTAYHGGQVTLNPLPHIRRSPFGTVIIPLVLLITSNGTMTAGFASAPYDPSWAQRHPKRAAAMAAAGPLSNVLLAVLAAIVCVLLVRTGALGYYRLGDVLSTWSLEGEGVAFAVAVIAKTFLLLNLFLALLNVFPWPPLDGSSVVEGFFPKVSGFYQYVRMQPFLMIAGFVAVWYLLNELFWPLYGGSVDLVLDLAR